MNVQEILENITKEKASDIFIVAGRPQTVKSTPIIMNA